jgi:predicted RNase H-like nuclease (RuvC/YqgF family)
MFRKIGLRLTAFLVCAASLPVLYAAAQDTQNAPSVAEAARRTRQQKQATSKPTTVLTNDNLPAAAPDAAANHAPNANANAPSETPPSENQPGAPDDADQKQSEIDALKKQIAEKQQGVDTLQREINLEQDNFYRKQDYQRDTAGKQKLESMQSDLKTKQDELNALKAKLTDLAGADALKSPAPASPLAGTSKP